MFDALKVSARLKWCNISMCCWFMLPHTQ